jgi:hypothetical protein
MKNHGFFLQPFPRANPRSRFELGGTIARRGPGALSVRYMLFGDMDELLIPEPASVPARKRGLWEETCFELFLAAAERPHYLELNLSPSGHWNVYRLEAYRQGMREESSLASLPFAVQIGPRSLRVSLELDLTGFFPAKQPVDVAISAVIKHKDGELTYWALRHGGPKPDFHRRDGFIIRM